jgi:hypothetical protein
MANDMAFEFNFDNLKTDRLADDSYINENRIITGKINSIKSNPDLRIKFRYPFKNLSPYVLPGFDFMELDSFAPTEAELDSYTSEQSDLETTYRASLDANLKEQYENNIFEYKYPGVTYSQPTPLASPTIFYKDVVFNVNVTRWKQLNQYDNWYRTTNTGFSSADLMPGVFDVNVLPPVKKASDLPATGNPGDLIIVTNKFDESNDNLYAWDVQNNVFSEFFYRKYFERVLKDRFNDSNQAVKAKNEAMLSIIPFVWAANYIPSYRINRDILISA